jgi:hypothetical protein
MSPLIPAGTLPGSERSRQFEGEEHGVGVSFFLVDSVPRHGPKLHRHAYEEIFSVESGKATFTLDGTELDAGPGGRGRRSGGNAPRVRELRHGAASADRDPQHPADLDRVAVRAPRYAPGAASPNGLPSESLQIAHRSPGCTTPPPSAWTRSSAAAMSLTAK